MTDSRADKIAALLAKAEGTDNEHERDAFAAAAEKLMLKWGIDEAMAAAAAATKTGAPVGAKMTTKYITWKATYWTAWLQLSMQIKLGVPNVMIVKYGNCRIAVLGTEGDVDRYITLFESVKTQAERAVKAWWKSYEKTGWEGVSDWVLRRQFILSFGSVVGQRLDRERRSLIDETVGSALVLVDQKAAVDLYVRQTIGVLGSSKSRGLARGTSDARLAGRAAGHRASIGGRAAIQ